MMGNARTNPACAAETENGNDIVFSDSLLKVTDNDALVVLHDYPSPDISQPIFRMGEKLRVISEDGCWLKVRSLITGNENYIPSNHVAKVYHGWLFEGVVRQKAEELLHLPGNRVGSFMIRESTRERGVYSLSVRHRTIKHYRIFRLPNNWYYISPRLTFQCLEDLVNHYSDIADGLCCILTAPCLTLATSNLNLKSLAPPVVMRRNFDWQNVQRSELLNQGSQCCPENREALISFGVRNSIASYLSLSGFQEIRERSFRKKKRKSFYIYPNRELSPMATDEDRYE